MLDEANYIKDQYFLEISSPGIERHIRKEKHLKESIGKEINIKLFKAIEKQKEVTGILKSFDEANIIIETETQELSIERKNISLMKLDYKW